MPQSRYTHRVQYESGRGHGLKTAYLHADQPLSLPDVWARLEALAGVPPRAVYDVITVENPAGTDHVDVEPRS